MGTISLPEDQKVIEETIVGIRRIIDGNTRRNSPLRHCLRTHQCEDLRTLGPQLVAVANEQLEIKRDKQGRKSGLVKRQNRLKEELDVVSDQLAELG